MGKIQVNPSTGKVLVSRDSAGNSKLCSTCCAVCIGNVNPPTILVDIAGITACPARPSPPSGDDFVCTRVDTPFFYGLYRHNVGSLWIDIVAGCADNQLKTTCANVYTGSPYTWAQYFFATVAAQVVPYTFNNVRIVGVCGDFIEEGAGCDSLRTGGQDNVTVYGYGGTLIVHT